MFIITLEKQYRLSIPDNIINNLLTLKDLQLIIIKEKQMADQIPSYIQEDLDNDWGMYSDIAMIAYQEGNDINTSNIIAIKVMEKLFDTDITLNPKHIEMIG
jgi:hypothetical protein